MQNTTFPFRTSILPAMCFFLFAAGHVSAKDTFYSFDGTLADTGSNGTTLVVAGTSPASLYEVSAELGGRQVLNFDKSFYLATTENISALNLGGDNSRTFSFWAKIDTFDEGGMFHIGTNGNTSTTSYDLCLRSYTASTSTFRTQMWGGGATFDFRYPYHGEWTLYTVTYDNTTNTVSTYVNGALINSGTRTLATTDSPLRVGTYYNGNYVNFDGQMADFAAVDSAMSAGEIRDYYSASLKQYGGFSYTFTDTLQMEDWTMSCGNNAIRVGSSQSPIDGGDLSSYTGGTTPTGCNVYMGTGDPVTGIAWGPVFTVLDETQSISLSLKGSGKAFADSQVGGAGVALWDVEKGEVIAGTYVSGTGNGTSNDRTISLVGLEGKTVMLVGIDRDTGSYGWFAIDNVSAPVGSVKLWDTDALGPMHYVVREYTFDTGWDGWYQVDAAGNRIETTSFTFGEDPNTPGNGLRYYIDSTLQFDTTKGGLLSSSSAANWDTPTGVIRSEEFIIEGDIIEFMIAGGATSDVGFQLMVDMFGTGDFTEQRFAQPEGNTQVMLYDYWNIQDLAGLSAYFRAYDNQTNNWGWIAVDNIRMMDFARVPEPSTWVMLLLGVVGMLVCRRRKV